MSVEHLVVNTLTLCTGDRVLVTTHHNLPPEEARSMKAALTDRFPGVEFTILGGVSGLAYQ
jgi:hypothetical protein